MNEVMESAMLQNLLISSTYNAIEGLTITVENRSHIMLGPTKITANLLESETCIFSTSIQTLNSGQRVQLQAPIDDVVGPVKGFIELQCISPGTQQQLTKRTSFRVIYFQRGRFQAVPKGDEDVFASFEVSVVSNKPSLTRVREILNLSPIQGILTAEKGRYRFEPAVQRNSDTVFYISVKEGGGVDLEDQVIVSAAGSASTIEERRRQCQEMINEIQIN
ncbi:hypothetical protein PsorP6_004311 [Peronosclerospora sorghi]|uniref:Uncharacterized protein n=1 Tax=Peronosclerospora sorghi TaxID=230839 RepID=A0ACC0VNS5_9STRA|nr:hypothetical protein PsorP6_004311 [Peronosclerospora sorghi]